VQQAPGRIDIERLLDIAAESEEQLVDSRTMARASEATELPLSAEAPRRESWWQRVVRGPQAELRDFETATYRQARFFDSERSAGVRRAPRLYPWEIGAPATRYAVRQILAARSDNPEDYPRQVHDDEQSLRVSLDQVSTDCIQDIDPTSWKRFTDKLFGYNGRFLSRPMRAAHIGVIGALAATGVGFPVAMVLGSMYTMQWYRTRKAENRILDAMTQARMAGQPAIASAIGYRAFAAVNSLKGSSRARARWAVAMLPAVMEMAARDGKMNTGGSFYRPAMQVLEVLAKNIGDHRSVRRWMRPFAADRFASRNGLRALEIEAQAVATWGRRNGDIGLQLGALQLLRYGVEVGPKPDLARGGQLKGQIASIEQMFQADIVNQSRDPRGHVPGRPMAEPHSTTRGPARGTIPRGAGRDAGRGLV